MELTPMHLREISEPSPKRRTKMMEKLEARLRLIEGSMESREPSHDAEAEAAPTEAEEQRDDERNLKHAMDEREAGRIGVEDHKKEEEGLASREAASQKCEGAQATTREAE